VLGTVAQWKSDGLLIHRLRVRIPSAPVLLFFKLQIYILPVSMSIVEDMIFIPIIEIIIEVIKPIIEITVEVAIPVIKTIGEIIAATIRLAVEITREAVRVLPIEWYFTALFELFLNILN
jgi:hypothetical protein